MYLRPIKCKKHMKKKSQHLSFSQEEISVSEIKLVKYFHNVHINGTNSRGCFQVLVYMVVRQQDKNKGVDCSTSGFFLLSNLGAGP